MFLLCHQFYNDVKEDFHFLVNILHTYKGRILVCHYQYENVEHFSIECIN